MQKTWRVLITLALSAFLMVNVLSQASVSEEAVQSPNEEAPVVLEDKTLFTIKDNLGPFTPKQRSLAIAEKIQAFAKDLSLPLDSLTLSKHEGFFVITTEDIPIMSINADDARSAGKDQQELATEYLQKIQNFTQQYRQEHSPRILMLGFLYAVISTVALILLFFILNNIFPRLYRQLEYWRETRIRAIRFQNLELLGTNQIIQLLISLARLLYWAIAIGLFCFYLPLVLSFFPWTKRNSLELFNYLVSTLDNGGRAFLGYIPNLFALALVITLTYAILRFLRPIFNALSQGIISLPGFYTEWAEPTFRLLSFLIIALAMVVAFPYLPGSGSPAFQGISIFLGVLFSLGSTSAIGNMVAGTILIYTRGFREGDRVKIENIVGKVLETNLLVTRILTHKNVVISIPNSQVLNASIENLDLVRRQLDHYLIIDTEVHLGYEVPWRQAYEALLEAAMKTNFVLTSPPPFVLQKSLDDIYVAYEINVYVLPEVDMLTIKSEIHENIRDCCANAGIRIFAPNYEADPITYPFNLESGKDSSD